MSQLDLGLAANVSARHISFLETGRARPSRPMVVQLSETLQVPRFARNSLLNAAGFAPAYQSRDLASDDMAHVRTAIDWMLDRHDPFPAFALDRHWTLLRANRSALAMLGTLKLTIGDSLLEGFMTSSLMQAVFENWSEVAWHMIHRLRTESAHLGGDPVLDQAANRLAEGIDPAQHLTEGTLPAVVPTRYRANGAVLSFFSTIAQFGTAEDIALADLKIELLFPADETTRQTLLAAAQG